MKVCVIGSGPSGLTTIKQLLDENHEVTCFEKNESVGGIWYRNNVTDLHEMKVYDRLTLTVSMKLMSFSDFMFKGKRTFFTQHQYLQYLEDYAAKFDLRKRISFNTAVNAVRKTADGKWRVAVTADGSRTEHTFDAVALCIGPFQKPCTDVTDLDKFTGEVTHSSEYRSNERFRNKRVLVVGLAESGADVLRQISDVSSECTLAIRSYSYLLPRLFAGRFSTDSGTTRAHHWEGLVRAANVAYPMKGMFGDSVPARAVFSACSKVYGLAAVASYKVSSLFRPKKRETEEPSARNNMGEPMFPRKIDLDTEWTQEHVDAINEWNRRSHNNEGNWVAKIIFCKNVTFIKNIVNGRIQLNDKGIARIDGKRVHFKNGEVKEFDAIVLCTGFIKDFSVLGPDIEVKDNNVRNLYRHCLHPDHEGRLALMGFVRPFSGGIPICSELQARYFAQLCSNKLKLPDDVRERIRKEKAWEEALTALSPRHTESIPSQALFCDAIARDVGCLMPLSELVTRPRLLVRHWFYPYNQACYRLRGPHAMYETALEEIMSDRRGPLSSNGTMLMFMGLSLLPHFMHPKDLDHVGPLDLEGVKRAKVKVSLGERVETPGERSNGQHGTSTIATSTH